jgi:pimeloyl-ACP methyl ester carboxylesterase
MTTLTATKSGYASVNGIELYYEIYGTGQPLVLLHGGIGAIEMFEPILSELAMGRQLIGVDLQAHGRTADIDRPMTCEAMADDVAALITHLGLGQVDVMGYSLGGGVAQQIAIRHPEVVRKLVIVSIACKRTGNYPEVIQAMEQVGGQMAEMMKPSPPYQLYSRIAPRPDDFPVLLTKVGELLRRDYDWTEDVAKLTMPVLLVFGDTDSVRYEHIVEFYRLVGGAQGDANWDHSRMPQSQLAILPGMSHYSILSSPLLAHAVIPFLDK